MTTPTAVPSEAQKLANAQAEEYGRYRAIAPIDHDGARAYNVGHPVPKSNVERYGYLEQGLVEDLSVAVEDDAPHLALSGEPGDAPHLALSGKPGDDTLSVNTGDADHPDLLQKEN